MFLLSSIFSFFFPPPPVENHETKTARLTHIFQNLLQREQFKNIWDEVNRNLHVKMEVFAYNPKVDGGHQPSGKLLNKRCPNDCAKRNEPDSIASGYLHRLGIRVNVERSRTDADIALSIIFETCNAKFWHKHNALLKQVDDSEITDPDVFATAREKIEWKALKLAKTIIVRTEYAPRYPHRIVDFDFATHLKQQKSGGHYNSCVNAFHQHLASRASKSQEPISETTSVA